MMNSFMLKKLSDKELTQCLEDYAEQREIESRRLTALANKKKQESNWSFIAAESGERVTIDTIIEVITAEASLIKDQLVLINQEKERRQGLNQTIPMVMEEGVLKK